MLFDNPDLLSNEEIREELTGLGYSTNIIDSIIEQFWFHDWGNSFISFPNNFYLLKNFLKITKPNRFSRFGFYTYFYHKVVREYEKLREPFQKLSLVFELIQTDQLSLLEFNNILKQIKAPKEISAKYLHDIQLISIIRTERRITVKWTHHTLTEYLAADYILNQKDVIKTAAKFIFYSGTGPTILIPSWTGTLRFLLEQNPESFIDWLISFIKKNPDSLEDQLAETLIFSASDSISKNNKTKLFHLVFDSYQNRKYWIPVWAYLNLFKFVDEEIYRFLKTQADNKDYILQGNIAATINGMLQHKHKAITPKEKEYWQGKLIKYANNENNNGVLQRHALAALENFKGETDIIRQVQKNATSPDSLVREAFINMCKEIDPNSADSITFFIKAITDDTAHIYARNALYAINSSQGIKTLLQNIADNPRFIHQFLDKESIFNNKEKQADKELIDNIQKNINPHVINIIKKIILNAFIGVHNYNAGKSYFLQQLTQIVQSKSPKYLEELLKTIQGLSAEQKNTLFINDIEGVIAVLLKPEDIGELKEIFTNTLHHHAGYTLAEAIRLAPQVGNQQGEAVLKKGIELEITADPKTFPKYDDYQKQQEVKIYKQFQEYLSPPTEGQYFPQVFRFFIENQNIIENQWKESEKERLLSLAIDSNLTMIDPDKIIVRYKDQKTKSGEYTISSIAGYFSNVLQVIHRLSPETLRTPKNRQKVINFIPLAYSSDLNVIQEILKSVTDQELTTVNKIMLDKNNDARYLIPQTYIYFSNLFENLTSPKDVLKSFVTDSLLNDSDREYSLGNLEKYLSPSNYADEAFLKKLWNPKIRNLLSDTANALLISVFHNEKAIAWRFEILKSSAKPYQRQEGAHSVGELELELDYMKFAKPLIELSDEKYLKQIIDLLDFSLSIIKKKDYWEYVNYLWRITIAFVVRENFLLSKSALDKVEAWADKNKAINNINWFSKRLELALNTFAKSIQAKNLRDAISLVEKLK